VQYSASRDDQFNEEGNPKKEKGLVVKSSAAIAKVKKML
jgi:hypothetical protein